MADYIRHNCQLNRQNVSLCREKCVYIFYKDIYIPIPCTNMTRDLEYMKGKLFEKLNGKALTNSICVRVCEWSPVFAYCEGLLKYWQPYV